MTYISSVNFLGALRTSTMQTESNLSNAQQEVSSGVYADLGLHLGGQTTTAISLAQESAKLTALTSSNAVASNRLQTTTSVLDTVISTAQSLSNSMVQDATNGTDSATIQAQAQANLQSLINTVNTTIGGSYIFGGTNTSNSPMANYTSTQAAVAAAVTSDINAINPDSSQITGDEMKAYLSSTTSNFASLYQSPGWSALGSASTTPITSQIAPSISAVTSITAREAGFQQISQAYSILSTIGSRTLGSDASQVLVNAATSLLNQGISSLTQIESNIGVTENNITNANSQMAAQQTILTTGVTGLVDTDPTTLSTQITSLQTQLQDSYSLTSQLKSLSLVNYLK